MLVCFYCAEIVELRQRGPLPSYQHCPPAQATHPQRLVSVLMVRRLQKFPWAMPGIWTKLLGCFSGQWALHSQAPLLPTWQPYASLIPIHLALPDLSFLAGLIASAVTERPLTNRVLSYPGKILALV